MSFGFSVGDFLAVGTIIKDICHCLNDSKGSKAEYQELLRELDCLQQALHHLDKLQDGSSTPSSKLDSIKYAALSCRHPLEQFLRKIKKYDTSLGVWSKDEVTKSAVNKLRWAFGVKQEVAKLQGYINIHIGTINILLAEHGLERLKFATEKAASDQLDIRERLSETHDIIKKCSGSLASQTLIVQNTQGMLVKLCKMINGEFISSWKGLENMVAKVCVSTQQIYTILAEIKTSLAGPDIRWTFFQAPYLVEDTLGYRFPVPSEYDFGLLDAVVKHRFNNGPGSTEVSQGNYEYFKTKDSSSVVSSMSRLLPGMAITMAVIVIHPTLVNEACPTLGCSSLYTTEIPNGGRTCPECNVCFSTTERRLQSLEDLAFAGSVLPRASIAERQHGNNPNKRKRAGSPIAEDEQPVFKNVRLSSIEASPESHLPSQDSSTIDERLSPKLEPVDSMESSINPPILNDALVYLDKIKAHFTNQPEVYWEILNIMKKFKNQVIDTPEVIKRVCGLFSGHPQLIHDFNSFLPTEYKIEVDWEENQNRIRATTPSGSSIVVNTSIYLESDEKTGV